MANVTGCDIHWTADVAGDSVWPTRAAGYNVLARVAARRWRYDGSVVDHILHVSAVCMSAAMLVMALVGMVRVSMHVIALVGSVRVVASEHVRFPNVCMTCARDDTDTLGYGICTSLSPYHQQLQQRPPSSFLFNFVCVVT
jgi:hypothetical protein